jgi:hypothetical protein
MGEKKPRKAVIKTVGRYPGTYSTMVAEPDPHYLGCWIRIHIRITVKSKTRIRIKVKIQEL